MKRPAVGVALVIRKGNKILLHKRKSKHANGTWACPGGHLEMYESFKDAAVRETLEEAGPDLVFTEPRLWTVCNTLFPEEDRHYVVVFLLCDYVSGEAQIMEPEKAEKWEWFDWHTLPKPLIEGNRQLKIRGISPASVDYTKLPE